MLNIEIDGKKLQVQAGSMVIEAADAAGLYIPRFCYHKKLSVAANCRMCLVDVEKVAKPVPACATPVTEGMRVFTRSKKTLDAQKGVMEFLLINHPLDCPICDQGGECDLQDLAVGYGKDVSRYCENKRIVKDEDLGPLIATDMTRCIHCTRCVRFGQEIAGLMELGATGRGEHMRIGTYVKHSVSSELSGNVIDLCPVGALTSKPFRYSARSWELTDMPGVSPHDCVGSNLNVQVLRNKVMRVLPRENDEVNECWLADRDRFSYEALNGPERLSVPMVREDGEWRETDWATALARTADGLRRVRAAHGGDAIGALASASATVEEGYLLQKLMRALGSNHVDHRLRRRDVADDAVAPPFPWLGLRIAEIEDLERALLIGANVRKEQPLIAHRLRKADSHGGAQIMAVNPLDYDFNFALAHKAVCAPADMLATLARIAAALAAATGNALPREISEFVGTSAQQPDERAIAEALAKGGRQAVFVGLLASAHPQAAALRATAELIAKLAGATLGQLAEPNAAGLWLAGLVPHRGPGGRALANPGRGAYAMLEQPLKAYLLFDVEPEVDAWDGRLARNALDAAEFVAAFSVFKGEALDYADVLLPLAAFTETPGTYVNAEGRWQGFPEAVRARGEARPGWKILRVLANQLELPGFDYTYSEEVCDEVRRLDVTASSYSTSWQFAPKAPVESSLVRVLETPIYAVDPIVRRAPSLAKTPDNPKPSARVNPAQAGKLGLRDGEIVDVAMGEARVTLPLALDARVPEGCVLVPAGYPETAALPGYGPVQLNRT